MKNVLVTGGAGFIGSHLAEALLKKGYAVTVLDNLIYGNREWVSSRAKFINGDICDLVACHEAMRGIDAVFHCAAMSRSAPSLEAIELCSRVNILGTQNILLAARDAGVKKIIYSGSSTYYGTQPTPHREDTPSQFLNTYALSKYVGEKYCLLFHEVFHLPCVILRYFNVYGARQPEEGNYALVLGIFLKRYAEGKALEIHGDGKQRRDFIHVTDVVTANILALESTIQGETFNVGSGTNISIKELADHISPNQIYGPKRTADAEETLADISHITNTLNWRPAISLMEGIQQLLKFNYLHKSGLDENS